MKAKLLTILSLFCLIASMGETAHAQDSIFVYGSRQLSMRADIILVGTPVAAKEGALPSTYKIDAILKGTPLINEKAAKVGNEINIKIEVISPQLDLYWTKEKNLKKPPIRVKKALFYLKKPTKWLKKNQYATLDGGVLIQTEKQGLLCGEDLRTGVIFTPVLFKDSTWDQMLKTFQSDLGVITAIEKIESIPDFAKRNQAIFKWIENHNDQFCNKTSTEWEGIEVKLYNLILRSCIPKDAWRAILMSKKLGTKENNYRHAFGKFTESPPTFTSPQGRKFLLDKVLDEKLPEKLRLTALYQLQTFAFWFQKDKYYAHAPCINVTKEEQIDIIDKLLPLLKHKDPSWRIGAVVSLKGVSNSHPRNLRYRNPRIQPLKTKRAIPELVKLFKTERNPSVRIYLIYAFRNIEDAAFWKNLTGNPKGIAIRLRKPRYKYLAKKEAEGEIDFSLSIIESSQRLPMPHTFHFQKIDNNGTNEKLKITIPTKAMFKTNWHYGGGMITMKPEQTKLKSGLWRVKAEGLFENETWLSEPYEIIIPAKN